MTQMADAMKARLNERKDARARHFGRDISELIADSTGAVETK